MKITTKPFGQIEVDERQIIDFPLGIFGFEDCARWALLDSSQPPFYWLQSLDRVDLAFVLISPFYFRPDYEALVDADDGRILGLTSHDDLLVFSIVTVPEDHAQMTANLQGPLFINKKLHRGKQAILTDARWKVKHVIVEELAAAGVR